MADKAFEINSVNCRNSPAAAETTAMSSPLRKVLDRISGLADSCRRNTVPRGRRIFHRDVEQEQDFQYSATQCLSSYYSVFVARLAIMVGQFSFL